MFRRSNTSTKVNFGKPKRYGPDREYYSSPDEKVSDKTLRNDLLRAKKLRWEVEGAFESYSANNPPEDDRLVSWRKLATSAFIASTLLGVTAKISKKQLLPAARNISAAYQSGMIIQPPSDQPASTLPPQPHQNLRRLESPESNELNAHDKNTISPLNRWSGAVALSGVGSPTEKGQVLTMALWREPLNPSYSLLRLSESVTPRVYS